jgi:hypothetical protein
MTQRGAMTMTVAWRKWLKMVATGGLLKVETTKNCCKQKKIVCFLALTK